MKRIDSPEILDADACSPDEVEPALRVIGRINRRFGGVATTQMMVERAAQGMGTNCFSMLEVAAGSGEVPRIVCDNLARRDIALKVTLLDMARSHLPRGDHAVVADALRIPFSDGSFDLVSCNLFAHHLNPEALTQFVREALRVSRHAVLINDLVRHPVHLALVYVSFPIMGSRVAWLDGLASVRRAYLPEELREIAQQALPQDLPSRLELHRHYLFRMGVIIWKNQQPTAKGCIRL
jgi:ubiquinone/menaquinone biosynthesis C-methylase UbiE